MRFHEIETKKYFHLKTKADYNSFTELPLLTNF